MKTPVESVLLDRLVMKALLIGYDRALLARLNKAYYKSKHDHGSLPNQMIESLIKESVDEAIIADGGKA
jgi:hypothetical protein